MKKHSLKIVNILRRLSIKICFVVLFFMFAEANAINYTWSGTVSQNWGLAANWSPSSGVPGAADNATINSGATFNPKLFSSVNIMNLTIGTGVVLDLDGFTLTVSGNFTVNSSTVGLAPNFGSLNISGAASVVTMNSSLFDVTIVISCVNISMDSNTFHFPFSVIKTGNTTSTSAGGNTFNGTSSFRLTGVSVSVSGKLILGNVNPDVFNNTVTFRNDGAAQNAYIEIAYTSAGNIFNGNIIIESTYGSATAGGSGIAFGRNGGSSVLQAGYTISIGASGFNQGRLYLINFTQLGTTPQVLDFNYAVCCSASNSQLILGPGSVFNGDVNFSSSNPYLNGCTFNGPGNTTISLEVNGGACNSNGGNVFNSANTYINNYATAVWTLAVISPDDFNGNVRFRKQGSGVGSLVVAFSAGNTFAGDISFDASFLTANPVVFGSNPIILDQGNAQSIYKTAAGCPPTFSRLTINKTANDVTINCPVSITNQLTFMNGRFFTSAANTITLQSTAAAVGATDLSYVNGPITKIGNTAFVFPVGKNGKYRPISISAPAVISEQFSATYFNIDPDPFYSTSSRAITLNNVSNCEYWLLSKSAGASDVVVDLSWDTPISCGITSIPDLRVANWNGTIWTDQGNGGTTGTISQGTISSAAAVASTTIPYTLASTTSLNPLPIELLQFNATVQNNKTVLLKWKTATEANNDFFTIQRSTTASSFEDIITVDGPPGGNSSNILDYSATDNSPFSDVSYYRLKQTDFNGTTYLSNICAVNIEGENSESYSAYPNPIKNVINITGDLEKINELCFYGTSGQIIKKVKKDFDSINISDFSNGIYYLQILLTNDKAVSLKIQKSEP